MLIIKGYCQPYLGQLIVTNDTIAVRWYDMAGKPLYWRAGTEKSLVEIGIKPDTGEIIEFELVIAHKVKDLSEDDIAINETNLEIINGSPICDIARWNPERDVYIVEEEMEIFVKVGKNSMCVEMDSSKPIKYLSTGSVIFGLNSHDALTFVELHNLSEEDIKLIRQKFNLIY